MGSIQSSKCEFSIMGYDMEMEDYHYDKEFEEKELERLKKEILE